jgi:polar amino acid transport system substrate-binding protein
VTIAAPDPAALRELAPTGTLRVGLNIANAATVRVDGDRLDGPAPKLATALAQWAGLPLEVIRYPSAGELVTAYERDQCWDIAFLAVDRARAHLFHFTPAYFTIEATALVPSASTIMAADQVDRPGVRIASSQGAAYDFVLQRELRHATRVVFRSPLESFEQFEEQELEAVAGIRQTLDQIALGRVDVRVLPGRLAAIEHAIASPVARSGIAMILNDFVRSRLFLNG